MDIRTSLRWAEVLAGGRRTRPGTTSLLDAQRPALDDFTLKRLSGLLRILGSHHLDEPEATAVTSVGVPHDVALLHIAMLLEQIFDLTLAEARMDAGDEKVRAGVHTLVSAVLLVAAAAESQNAVVRCTCVEKNYRSSRPLAGSSRILVSPSRSGPGERERSRGG